MNNVTTIIPYSHPILIIPFSFSLLWDDENTTYCCYSFGFVVSLFFHSCMVDSSQTIILDKGKERNQFVSLCKVSSLC